MKVSGFGGNLVISSRKFHDSSSRAMGQDGTQVPSTFALPLLSFPVSSSKLTTLDFGWRMAFKKNRDADRNRIEYYNKPDLK
jgi:hypothetical protein